MRLHRFLRNRAVRLARRVSSPVLEWHAARAPRVLALSDVQRRLELLLGAMYGGTPRIGSLLDAAVSPEGSDVVLPSHLGAADGRDEAFARFRLLAIAQAARLARGTYATISSGDALAHDLYLMAESAAVERAIAERAPGLVPALQAMRADELARRATRDRLRPDERAVEQLFRDLLASPADEIPAPLPVSAAPEESRAWAWTMALEIRRASGGGAIDYRPLRMATLWGTAWSPFSIERGLSGLASGFVPASEKGADGEGDEGAERDEDDDAPQPDDDRSIESAAVPESAPPEHGTRTAGGSVSEERASTDDVDPQAPRDQSVPSADDQQAVPAGRHYPEWDAYAHRLLPDATTVHCSVAEETDAQWAADVLREHAPLVRQVRDHFAPLRARLLRLRRQRAGDELDIDACVAALADRRVGQEPSDRLYQVTRPARHSVAIMLLVDTSGSTKVKLDDGRTVLDVERMTLLLASEALATLGDPYAMLAFSGRGRHGVRVRTVKSFDERDDAAVRRRISALEAGENTRLGAAIRHATAMLGAQAAQRRILLVLSDGQPNDVQGYQGSYGIEDSRRAVLDARTSGVHPFCLTVDQEEREYLPRLFGTNGYLVIERPGQLPKALLTVVERMLRG